MTGLISFY